MSTAALQKHTSEDVIGQNHNPKYSTITTTEELDTRIMRSCWDHVLSFTTGLNWYVVQNVHVLLGKFPLIFAIWDATKLSPPCKWNICPKCWLESTQYTRSYPAN